MKQLDTPAGSYAENFQPLEHNHMHFVDARVVTRILNDTLGRVLTIVEAAVSNDKQREAVKALIKSAVSESHDTAYVAWLQTKSIEFAIAPDKTRAVRSPLAHMFTGPCGFCGETGDKCHCPYQV